MGRRVILSLRKPHPHDEIQSKLSTSVFCEAEWYHFSRAGPVEPNCGTLENFFHSNNFITDADKKICKNIQRLHETHFMKLELFGLGSVDAMLPVALFGLLTNYTLVLLQFMLLPSEQH